MPLGPKRLPLQMELVAILGNPDAPLTGMKFAKALSNFSKGILPPTLGVFTGISPAAAAYDATPPFQKTLGMENAINIFATFNASGMPLVIPGFIGIPGPPIFGLQRLFDIVRKNNGTVEDIAKALSYAILANYSLGSSSFTPLSVTVPTWNIPFLPGSIKDEIDESEATAKMALAAKQAEAEAEITDWQENVGPGPEQQDFFDRMSQA
tara:strand:- start:15203 stop:15829 length:627 start_codon:yes stop_codon:yes gene_type:complete